MVPFIPVTNFRKSFWDYYWGKFANSWYTLFTPQNFAKVLSSIYFRTTVKLRIKQWLCKILEGKQSVIWIM